MTFKSTTRTQIFQTTVKGIKQTAPQTRSVSEQFVNAIVASLSELKLSQLPQTAIQLMADHGIGYVKTPPDGDVGVQVVNDKISLGGQDVPITFLQTWMPDQPFIFDTILLSLTDVGYKPIYSVNTVLSVTRSKTGAIQKIQPGKPLVSGSSHSAQTRKDPGDKTQAKRASKLVACSCHGAGF